MILSQGGQCWECIPSVIPSEPFAVLITLASRVPSLLTQVCFHRKQTLKQELRAGGSLGGVHNLGQGFFPGQGQFLGRIVGGGGMRALNLKGGMGSRGVVWAGQCSSHYSSQQPALEFSQQRDPQAAGPPLPFPSESPEIPGNLHTPGQPLTNDEHKHPASFTTMVTVLKCDPSFLQSSPLGLSHGPLHGMDACLMSPSCFVPLPLGPMSPFR